MKIRVYIRDIIWLTLLVACSLAIYRHYEQVHKQERELYYTLTTRLTEDRLEEETSGKHQARDDDWLRSELEKLKARYIERAGNSRDG